MMNPPERSRILIADHDHTFLDQLADRLLQMDMEVDFAENGRTAIHLVETESYGLIITEIAMPIYNGLEILRRAKDCLPGTPILITSFSATTDWAEQAVREGAHSYLLRPLNDLKKFDRAVKDALQVKRTANENAFFNQILSKNGRDDFRPEQADIPIPDWELNHQLGPSVPDLELSRPKPLNQIPFVRNQDVPNEAGQQGKRPDPQHSTHEGAIELNSQGQILTCDPAARNWLLLEAKTPNQPIKRFIKDLGSGFAPEDAEIQVNGRRIHVHTNRIRDRMGSERIILRIREITTQSSDFPASSTKRNSHSPKGGPAKAPSAVPFGGNLKKYNPGTVDQGWSPLVFIDQMKKTVKDEVEKIKENNLLQIFEPRPEEIDPETVMTMSRRLSDISRGRRSSF